MKPIPRKYLFLPLAILTLATGVSGAPVPKSPNIVILYADDMGYGDVSVQNPESKIPTPNLDRLASEGMRFTDAHSSSGICTPSRFALLTGMYHWRRLHGIVNSWEGSVFKAEDFTLPEMLRQNGYTTACIGKWHLGWDWEALRKPDAPKFSAGNKKQVRAAAEFDWSKPIPDGPLAHGFDHYFGDDVPNFPPYTWIKDDRVVTPPTVPFVANPKPEEGTAEARPGPMAEGWRLDAVMPTLTKTAVDWIASQKGSDKPFFLYFPWTSPHAPIVPTPEWKGRTQAGPYGDFMAQSDWTAGEVLKALKENGFAENTIVIFSADNGPEHFAYERARNKGHRSMGAFRGLKRDLWEGGHRIPFTVRWPGVVPKGSVSDGLLSQTDLFATLATAIGAKLPPQAAPDSFNQLELWKGTGSSTRPSMVHNTSKDSYAIRRGTWTLVDAPTGAGTRVPKGWDEANGIDADDQPAALYDMRADPGQKHNLLTQHPDVVAELRKELHQLQQDGRSRPASTE